MDAPSLDQLRTVRTEIVEQFKDMKDLPARASPPAVQIMRGRYDAVMVSFTAATSCASVKGLGRKANCWFSGRLFSKASSA
jgi:hypothetical protein